MTLNYFQGYAHGIVIGIAVTFTVLCLAFREVRTTLFAKVELEAAECDGHEDD